MKWISINYLSGKLSDTFGTDTLYRGAIRTLRRGGLRDLERDLVLRGLRDLLRLLSVGGLALVLDRSLSLLRSRLSRPLSPRSRVLLRSSLRFLWSLLDDDMRFISLTGGEGWRIRDSLLRPPCSLRLFEAPFPLPNAASLRLWFIRCGTGGGGWWVIGCGTGALEGFANACAFNVEVDVTEVDEFGFIWGLLEFWFGRTWMRVAFHLNGMLALKAASTRTRSWKLYFSTKNEVFLLSTKNCERKSE